MPETQEPTLYIKPFVYETEHSKSLHFSICEIQSRMQLQDPHVLSLEYTRLMMGFLLFIAEPQDITMIGLGGGSLAKFCHRFLPRTRILVVEINPHVIALRDAFHVPPDDGRFKVLRADGALSVRDGAAQCDVLMVDGFDIEGLPSQLSSQRFYDDCFETLRPGGMMVVNLHYAHPLYEVYLERIRRSFSHAVLVAGDGERSNSIVFAGKGRTFAPFRPGPVRSPKNLDSSAAKQLLAAFARITTALRDQRDQVDNAHPV